MVEFKATLKLIPSIKPRRTEKFPGNFPSTEETELAGEFDEAEKSSEAQQDTRELIFDAKTKLYVIGRASSNPARGLTAGRSNGYFLSPVMSRYHAEIQMVEKKKVIRLRDTHSMHGTFVNGEALWTHQWKTLNTGDTITFGTQVARDGEVFSPKDFKCQIQWETIPDPVPESAKEMTTKTDRRCSGYGVSSEDLIISDDDTESVDYDKGVEYACYTEEDYSENGEEDEEEEEDEEDEVGDDEVTEFDGEQSVTIDFKTTLQPPATSKPETEAQKASADSARPETDKPAPPSTTASYASSRTKFSISSVMNETKESREPKPQSNDQDIEMKDPVEKTNNDEKEPTVILSATPKLESSRFEEHCKWVPGSQRTEQVTSYEAPKISATMGVDSASESDEPPEELDTKGRSVTWSNIPTISSNKHIQESIQKTTEPFESIELFSSGQPGKFDHLLKAANVFAEEKRKPDVTIPSACLNSNANTTKTPSESITKPTMADKADFFTAMKENAAKFKWPAYDPFRTMIEHQNAMNWPKYSSPRTNEEILNNPAPMPKINIEPMVQGPPVKSNPPVLSREPHLFERILSSDEARLRKEKLEKLKAVIYRNKDEPNFIPWAVVGNPEFPYFEDEVGEEDMVLDEHPEQPSDISSGKQQRNEEAHVNHELPAAPAFEAAPSRGFSISNLVHEQPETDFGKWIAEKVSKNANLPQPSTSGVKRKCDAISADDKIVQETLEEKIQFADAIECNERPSPEAREISQEKETYQESFATPVELNSKERAVEDTNTPVETVIKGTTVDAEVQEPARKKSRVWPGIAAGFAVGTVTGAVGLFAALVASAP